MDTSSSLSFCDDFPIELVIQILQLTASISRTSAANIALVSSWAHKIALPYIFSTVVRQNVPYTARSSASLVRYRDRIPSQWSPSTNCGQFIRHLWAENIGVTSHRSKLFSSCPNLEDLALAPDSLRSLANALMSSSREHTNECQSFAAKLRSLTLTVHTFRFDWHPLVDIRLANGSTFLHNITHLRILDLKISSYVPHEYLPNLTHIALPYLDLMPNIGSEILRVPDGLLDHSSLQMLVLTLDEHKWLGNPWYHTALHAMPGPRTNGSSERSPRSTFRELVKWTGEKDDRIYVVLSPRASQTESEEWEEAARGGRNIWEKAAESRTDETYALEVPDVFPRR